MGVEPGAEVIVPAYTFEATASAALFAGCAPVFADIDPETYCIDVERGGGADHGAHAGNRARSTWR